MSKENEGKYKYGYHLYAFYRDHDDVRFKTEFYEPTDVKRLEERITSLLNDGYDQNDIHIIYGKYTKFTSEKEVITNVVVDRDG